MSPRSSLLPCSLQPEWYRGTNYLGCGRGGLRFDARSALLVCCVSCRNVIHWCPHGVWKMCAACLNARSDA